MKSRSAIFKIIIIVSTVGAVLLQWATDTVRPNNFIWEVYQTRLLPFLETRYLYFYLHLFALSCVLPMSFERKIHYYKYWKALFPALLIVAVVFLAWDSYKTYAGVWGFNPEHYTFLVGNLPIEEWFFFITFPFASIFIYESLNYYIKKDPLVKAEPYITPLLIVLFTTVGLVYWSHAYTATTFIVCGGFLLYHYIYVTPRYRSRFYAGLLVGYLPFILVNGALTGTFTEQPVVVYNPEEYLGIRFLSIPLDDFAYNFILEFSVITLYEFFKVKMRLAGTTTLTEGL
ncbi:MAG: lycopene cyclase domain-containing protein [Saprospiraceae bacterium]